ncbi:MAG: hypothetical protein OEY56_09985, partial [Cyclobacteriaceae bacterium]|nr:hypothetical protein [Cyclobacteriaceae bacterium]
MPLTPLNGVLGKKRAAHFLRRTCFGGTVAEIDEFANLTAPQAVARLFDPTLPDPATPIDPAIGQEWLLSGALSPDPENG